MTQHKASDLDGDQRCHTLHLARHRLLGLQEVALQQHRLGKKVGDGSSPLLVQGMRVLNTHHLLHARFMVARLC